VKDTLASSVTLDSRGISIDGRRTIVFCASLFYFRIPEGSWEDRMKKIRLAGYNCIDVYFPWNFHETAKDTWDLSSGMKDVDTFLTLAEKHGLYVMARPGPYICSEWDGGSLPAYLFAEGVAIRQNDPAYLERVEEWYDRILPIIVEHQIDKGGSVVLLQIENELDFFSCSDVPGYIGALARSARAHGITVPVFACAGQGDIYGAWGRVDDVVPTMNLYLDSKLPGLEQGISDYTRILAGFNTPLMITEMGRDNLIMRRFLASGAKLLGPYNQVAGFDFGFTQGVNNWGDPVSFQTSYYDFLSLITPYGEIRDFITDDRVLSGFMSSMGELLAGSVIAEGDEITRYTLKTDSGTPESPPVLSLGGQKDATAVAVSNLSDAHQLFQLDGCGKSREIELSPLTSAFVLTNIDLSVWGIPARLDSSTAEPVYVRTDGDPVIVWQAPIRGRIDLTVDGDPILFTFESTGEARKEVNLPDGRTLTMFGTGRALAARVTGVSGSNLELLEEDYATMPESSTGIDLSFLRADTDNAQLFSGGPVCTPDSNHLEMEKSGFLNGYGLYAWEGSLPAPTALVLHGASDIISVYRDGAYVDTRYPGGVNELVELPAQSGAAASRYEVRAEIWGHSNFDDSRKPAIRIRSLRGVSGITEVREITALPWWQTDSPAGGDIPYYGSFGGHLTTDRPACSTWYNSLSISESDDSVLLRFDGMECDAEIEVNGKSAGRADAFTSLVDVSRFIRRGERADLTVRLTKRHYEEPAGRVSIVVGKRVKDVRLSGATESVLLMDSERSCEGAVETTFPVQLEPGRMGWLHAVEAEPGRIVDHKVEIAGMNIKASVFYNGTLCGRLFLPPEGGPKMVWKSDWGYLPGCWSRKEGNTISFFLEAVGKEPAVLETISVAPLS
jgi:beta-galactosidase